MKRRNKSTDSGGRAAPRAGSSESAEASDDLAPGTVLGKYRIVERLGTGGMGSVYKAVHTGIAKSVALKTMSPQLAADPRTSARFLREAASASRLDHPHVVGVTDFGSDLGVSYLVMELLRGEDLGALIARSPGGLPTVMVADIMLAVCAGVFAAHESGVVHRDLKPPNIFVAQTSLGESVPKVLDFGISKMIEEDGSSPLTNTGMVMGTTHYLSPEQVAGKGADVRSDQYALGVIMYEALTGQRPFAGNSAYEIMHNISEGAHPPVRSLRKDLTAAFAAVIVRAMAIDAHNRFESVHGLGRALLAFASPKRRVMWADYYERDSGRTSDPRLSARAESGETIALDVRDVRPAQLSPTRTHFAAAPPRVARETSTPVSGTGVVEFPDSLSTGDYRSIGLSRGRRRWGPALLFAIGAGIGVLMFWKIPALRAKLPAVVQTALERTTAGRGEPAGQEPVAEAPPEATTPAAAHPLTTATTQTAPAHGNPRISPFSTADRSSSWPFEPPSKDESKYKAAAITPSPDSGVTDGAAADVASGTDVGRTPAATAAPVAASSAPATAAPSVAVVKARPVRLPPNPDRELPVVYPRSRRQQSARVLQGLPLAGQSRRVPATPPQTAPAESGLSPPATQEPAPLSPEQIPPKRYFPAGRAPILD